VCTRLLEGALRVVVSPVPTLCLAGVEPVGEDVFFDADDRLPSGGASPRSRSGSLSSQGATGLPGLLPPCSGGLPFSCQEGTASRRLTLLLLQGSVMTL
jgi:hypothetical protein